MNPNGDAGEAKRYWKSPEELTHGPLPSSEFTILSNEPVQIETTTRRSFLASMGFSLAAAGLAGCRAPVQNAIPLLVGGDGITPGVPNWYATTCRGCEASCSLLVKTRDGRPIKVEGNDKSPLFGGGTCAVGQATVLSLYDDERLRGPVWDGHDISWKEMDERILASLSVAKEKKSKIVLISGAVVSPSTREIIAEWGRKSANFRHIIYEPVSLSALRTAQLQSYGLAVVPHYRFDKARVIVSLAADFLGTWLSPVEFTRQYADRQRSNPGSSLHVQFESGLSVTGSNADLRVPIAPSEMGAVAVSLLRRVAQKAGIGGCPQGAEPLSNAKILDSVADELWRHRGESLVVSGVQDVSVQIAVNAMNSFLSNLGKTLDLAHPSFQGDGDDTGVSEIIGEMNRGEIHAVILYGVNPGYDHPQSEQFLQALERIPLSISLSDRRDETSSHVHAICPDHHFLEAWGDAEAVDSHYSLSQPTIAPLFATRSAQESMLRWIEKEPNYYAYLRDYWNRNIFPQQKELQTFDSFWDNSLRDGVVVLSSKVAPHVTGFRADWQTAARKLLESAKQAQDTRHEDRYEVELYQSVAIRDGRHANNPWLQELPDPITKVTWGNFAAIAPSLAARLGIQSGDIVSVKADTGAIELPAMIQPGQDRQTISVALGYGRTDVGKAGRNVGANAYPLSAITGGLRTSSLLNVTIARTGRKDPMAATQLHFSLEGRPIIQEVTLEELSREPSSSAESAPLPSLWAPHPEGDHSWGMVIDLNACTGCSACVIACQAENNVPVVGKEQVRRSREMHWIRLDSYYSGPEDNPTSVHQPMMCQHCGNAPCETVCPVLATTHSSDGLNQQVYNRCVGTRYCANNCPYKVRRFNWFEYAQNPAFDYNIDSPLGRMVLNPDVAVRSRGVMEKCSLCIQRIQAGKLSAKQERRQVADGDIATACQQACPAEAIVFGDLKDPASRASQMRRSQRHYDVLEELGTRPNVGYLKKVRNLVKT